MHYVDGMTLEEVARGRGAFRFRGEEKAAPAERAHASLEEA